MLLDGVFVPVPTSFYRDGRLYLKKVEHNVERYSRTPVAGLAVLGPLAEAESLTDAERRSVLETAASVSAPEKVLIAGVGSESVRGTLELAKVAADAMYDVALVGTPRTHARQMHRGGEDHPELLAYFRAIADGSSLPILLWDRLAYKLPLSVIVALASHANVIGMVLGEDAGLDRLHAVRAATAEVKREVEVTITFTAATRRMLRPAGDVAAGGTFIQASSLGSGTALAFAPPKPAVKTRSKQVGFQIVTSATAGMIPGFDAKATGAMPRMAASIPQACFEVWAAWKDRDPALIAVKQSRVAAVEALFEESGVAATKYGCDLNGYFGGYPRLPLLPLSEADRVRVQEALREMRS